jgi:4-methylaminobutanoate oxidase (formaldehyde-forming)
MSITSGMYGNRVDASLGVRCVRADDPITADWIAAQKFENEIG